MMLPYHGIGGSSCRLTDALELGSEVTVHCDVCDACRKGCRAACRRGLQRLLGRLLVCGSLTLDTEVES